VDDSLGAMGEVDLDGPVSMSLLSDDPLPPEECSPAIKKIPVLLVLTRLT